MPEKKASQMTSGKPGKKLADQYIRYTNIAFQMAIIIGGGMYGGVKLDRWMDWKFPLFTVTLSLLAVTLAIYISIRDFLKKP